jgi:hypothetical protein
MALNSWPHLVAWMWQVHLQTGTPSFVDMRTSCMLPASCEHLMDVMYRGRLGSLLLTPLSAVSPLTPSGSSWITMSAAPSPMSGAHSLRLSSCECMVQWHCPACARVAVMCASQQLPRSSEQRATQRVQRAAQLCASVSL